jgi:hypothetical protein
MKKYQFKTTATMKEYNNKKWWIDSRIIPEISITADSLEAALQEYRERVQEKYYVSISNNALKNKQEMYIDLKDGTSQQCGYVITGKTDFEDRDNYKWTAQYIDLWVTINQIVSPWGVTAL